jgi:uncharacterized protein YjiS (DUF1127 family)
MKYQAGNPSEIPLTERRFDVSRPGRRLASLLRYAWLQYRQWRTESEAVRHLRRIDDHLPDDVGIDRREIDAVVRGGNGCRENAHPRQDPPPRINPCGKVAV